LQRIFHDKKNLNNKFAKKDKQIGRFIDKTALARFFLMKPLHRRWLPNPMQMTLLYYALLKLFSFNY